MSITTTCCHCGARQPLAAGFAEDDGKRFGAAMGLLPPPVARAVVGYLALFKPPKTELRLARATKIVASLAALIDEGTVCADERSKIRRAAPPAVWVAGIEQMVARPPSGLPLDNHNYLRVVVFDLAGDAAAFAPAGRPGSPTVATGGRAGPSPEAPREDPLQAALAHLRMLRDYDQIDDAEYDRRCAEERAKHGR